MVDNHSYNITTNDNQTKKEGLNFILESDPNNFVPDSDGRKHTLDLLGVDQQFSRVFNLIQVEQYKQQENILEFQDLSRITLIELKISKKTLPALPRGFFFGATQNEFELAELLGERYKFAFTSLHPDTKGFQLLTLSELESLIKTKRIQYQINLHS